MALMLGGAWHSLFLTLIYKIYENNIREMGGEGSGLLKSSSEVVRPYCRYWYSAFLARCVAHGGYGA